MKIFIATEFRCQIYRNKVYLAPKAFYIYKRYADVFGEVILCCRAEPVIKVFPGYKLAYFVKEVVEIHNLFYVPIGKYNHIIGEKMGQCSLVIARVPSMIAYMAAIIARKNHIPYLAEVMGDAWDSYWNHGLLGKSVAPAMYFVMKKLVLKADYAIYVTKYFLQKRYPCNNFSINASNVVIQTVPDDVLYRRIKKIKGLDCHYIKVMTTAAVDVEAKGQQFVIKTIRQLKKRGIYITYYLAGGGSQKRLKTLAAKEGVESAVVFLGELTMEKVYEHLDNIDVYIQPSLQEGLPRAVIEAMSRGCFCLGSDTAGTPELLKKNRIFKRASVAAITHMILSLTNDDLIQDSIRNFHVAQQYNENNLNVKRNNYLKNIKDILLFKK